MTDPALPGPSTGDAETGGLRQVGEHLLPVETSSYDFVRSTLDCAPDAMVIVDSSGRLVFANREANHLFGYAAGEIIGKNVEALMPAQFRAQHVGHRMSFTRERSARPMGANLDLFAQRKDGSSFPAEISLSPVQQGAELLFIAAIRDVTERKRVQSELLAARDLADRARQLADAAREEADRANRAKSLFLATASHDLRQPLQSLALLNGTLRRLVRDEDALITVTHQDRAIDAMSRLLNALLDISKLESGAIEPELTDFPVDSLFDQLRNEFAGLATSKGLDLRVETCTACVQSDPSLVGQILRNLLANAIKYTHSGIVHLRSVARAGAIRVEVIDTGIGISVQHLPHIYDEFYQVGVEPNTTRDGYGLGLSIVRRLVELLKLKLEVQSEPGKGSRFALDLPPGRFQVAARAHCATSVPAAPQEQAPLVLLVEDDVAVRDATRLLLKVEGYRVLVAGSVAEVRKCVRENPGIELLITDYHLRDGETGMEVILLLRGLIGPDSKAILVTGDTSSMVRDLDKDHRLRIAQKPIGADELLGMMRSLLAT